MADIIAVKDTIEIDGEEVDVYVNCYYSPIVPAIKTGDPDNWSPEEGGFEGVDEVTRVDNGLIVISEIWENQIRTGIIKEKVSEAISECDEDEGDYDEYNGYNDDSYNY